MSPFIRRWSLAAAYVAAAAIPAGSNFFLTLLLVRSLGINGFAEWAIIEPILLIGAAASPLGTQFGALNATATRAASPQRVLFTGFAVSLSASLVVAATGAVLLGHLFNTGLGLAFAFALCADALATVAVSSLRGSNRPGTLAAFESVRSFGLVLSVFIVYWLRPEWIETPAQFLIYRFAATMIAIGVAGYIIGLEPCLDRPLRAEMMRYGLPLLGATAIGLAMTNLDRYLLTFLGWGAPLITAYVAHQRLAGILSVTVVTPLQLWFPAETMRRGAAGNESFFRSVVAALLAWLVVIECSAVIIAPIIWSWLFPQVHFQPLLFLLLAAAVIPQALAIAVNIGALQQTKTSLNIIGAAVGFCTNLAIGVPLTVLFGNAGAAAARLGAFTTYMVAFRQISQRITPVHHPLFRLIPFGLGFALIANMSFTPPTSPSYWLCALLAVGLAGLGMVLHFKRNSSTT